MKPCEKYVLNGTRVSAKKIASLIKQVKTELGQLENFSVNNCEEWKSASPRTRALIKGILGKSDK